MDVLGDSHHAILQLNNNHDNTTDDNSYVDVFLLAIITKTLLQLLTFLTQNAYMKQNHTQQSHPTNR